MSKQVSREQAQILMFFFLEFALKGWLIALGLWREQDGQGKKTFFRSEAGFEKTFS
jgi:hypothetical protein